MRTPGGVHAPGGSRTHGCGLGLCRTTAMQNLQSVKKYPNPCKGCCKPKAVLWQRSTTTFACEIDLHGLCRTESRRRWAERMDPPQAARRRWRAAPQQPNTEEETEMNPYEPYTSHTTASMHWRHWPATAAWSMPTPRHVRRWPRPSSCTRRSSRARPVSAGIALPIASESRRYTNSSTPIQTRSR
jgi:hypothetical protein